MDNETKARIENEAEELVSKSHGDKAIKAGRKKWYIAGATAEHSRITELLKEERVRVIDECLAIITSREKPIWLHRKLLKQEFEALKGKQQ